jgi:Na+/melibiose symporter-like transporter
MCIFIGVFFIITINLLCAQIKEKRQKGRKGEKSYFTPTLFRLWNNGPFMSLIIPWILDVTTTQIFATMLPFYINYVINPQKYCIDNNIDIVSDVCSPTQWLGMTIFIFFTFCIGSTFLWHYFIGYVGKKRAWQSYSLMSICTFSLFLLCGEGDMWLLILLSILNALPGGGSYLNDVFISDVIDYDEFITGKRNEGIYIVFSAFTPKLVGIFAQSIPLTVMSCKISLI